MRYQGLVKDLRHKMGIYQITCTANGRIYIGSSRCLGARLVGHRSNLNYSRHPNPHLQHAWDKYGSDAFIFEVLEICPEEYLELREQAYIDELQPFSPIGFNLCPIAYSQRGIKRTPSTIQQRLDTIYADMPDITILSPEGELFTFKNIAAFSREHGLLPISLGAVLSGKIKYTGEGWRLPGEPPPERCLLNREGQKVLVRNGKLRNFCKENNLNYNHIGRVLRGSSVAHKGWTHGDRIDLYIDLTGPHGQQAKICKESYTWFIKKHGLRSSNFSAMITGKNIQCTGWVLKENAHKIYGYYQVKNPNGEIVSIDKGKVQEYARSNKLNPQQFTRTVLGDRQEYLGYESLCFKENTK